MINTATYSYASLAFADDFDKFVFKMECISGIGSMCSSVLGYFINEAVGLTLTFLICGLAFLPSACFLLYLKELGARGDDGGKGSASSDKNSLADAEEVAEPPKGVTYSLLMRNQRILHAALAGAVMALVTDAL